MNKTLIFFIRFASDLGHAIFLAILVLLTISLLVEPELTFKFLSLIPDLWNVVRAGLL